MSVTGKSMPSQSDDPSRAATAGGGGGRAALGVLRSEGALVVAIVTAAIFYTLGKGWLEPVFSQAIGFLLFAWIFGVMLWSAFAAVRHADCLAELLGEPYGTLVLTISVISIEVAVISAVMLHGDADPALARDTMMAVMMIVLNGMVGVSLLIGGLRHGEQEYNLRGTRAFLSVLITLCAVSLVLPSFTTSTPDPSLTTRQAIIFSLVTVALYGTFLAIQTMRHSNFFLEAEGAAPADAGGHGHKARSVPYHAFFLVLTLVPIVFLSKKLAILVDAGTDALHAPPALGGILVALMVLSPEGLAAFRAASANHLQRAVNICFGSALATISLTVPAVVIVALLTGRHLILGLEPTEIVLLVLTLVVSLNTFSGPRTNVLQGAVNIVIFLFYLILVFDP